MFGVCMVRIHVSIVIYLVLDVYPTSPLPLLAHLIFVLQDGWSPLMAASCKGHVEVVKSLIEGGANSDHINKVSTFTVIGLY